MRDYKAVQVYYAVRHLMRSSRGEIGGLEMPRQRNTRSDGTAFDSETIEKVWGKGTPEPDYPSFRKDCCGASMKRDKYGLTLPGIWPRMVTRSHIFRKRAGMREHHTAITQLTQGARTIPSRMPRKGWGLESAQSMARWQAEHKRMLLAEQ
jgi:hypothetical protein